MIAVMRRISAIATAAVLASIAPVSAQSLKELRAREGEERALSAEAAFTGKVCGDDISASIDWSSVRDWPAGASIASACGGALSAVETVCRRGRKAFVRRFVCAGDGAGPRLSGSTLRYGASPGRNGFAETKSYLGN